jgi:hypothetical protein
MIKSFEVGKFYSYEVIKYSVSHRTQFPVLFNLHIIAECKSLFTGKDSQLIAEYYTTEGAQGFCAVDRSIAAQIQDSGNVQEITEKEFMNFLNKE